MSKPLPSQDIIDRGYALLRLKHNLNPSTGKPLNLRSNTNESHKFGSTLNLHETASRLKDGSSLLGNAVVTLLDNNTTKRQQRDAGRLIKKTIIPLMDKAAAVSERSAATVSPIGGSAYVHQRVQK